MEDKTQPIKLKKTDTKSTLKRQILGIKLKSHTVPQPVFKPDTGNGIIKWGKRNLLPDYYIDTYQNTSGKHQAIINRKVLMIAGKGFEEVTDQVTNDFIENVNGKYSLEQIAKLNATDREVLNGFGLVVRWNGDKSKIGAVEYMPGHKIRKSLTEGVFKISNDWQHPKKPDSKTFEIREFDREQLPEGIAQLDKEDQKTHLVQLIFFQEIQIGSGTYPIPYYNAGLNWILSDGAIGDFTLNMVKKNFAGGYHIGFKNGIPEDDERQAEKDNFQNEYGGENGDSIIVTFSEPEDNPIDFNPLPSTGNEDIYESTEIRAQVNIFIIHQVTNPELFGVLGPAGLGDGDKEGDLKMFQAVYIDQRQNDLERVYNMLNKINGGKEEIKFKKFTLQDLNQ